METLEIKNENATCIKIPDTVTNIDYNKAFLCCDKLECIECDSDYFKSIDGVLFTADYKTLVRYPSRKKSISYIIPESVINIEQCAFKDCRSLENIVLPNSLISIGERAFLNCSSLQKIIFPDSLTSIGWNAFYSCKKIQKVVLPDFLANIEGAVFAFCSDLESIECNSAFYKSIDGVLFTADYKTLVCYPSKKNDISYIVPKSVTHIGHFAFSNCESLERVILPSSLISIGRGSFFQCFYLQNIELSDSLTEIGREAFSFCKSLREINLPNSVLEIGDSVFENCSSLRQVILSASLSCIPENAFYNCEKLKKITLPDSIKHIGKKAFYYCKSLRDIKLSKNIANIDSGAFGNCKSLEEIELPDLVKKIEERLFYGCESLQEIELPENIENINSGAFNSCKSLEIIRLPESVKYIGDNVFLWCESLETIVCNNEQYQVIDGVLFDRTERRCICYPQGKIGRKYIIPENTIIIGESAFWNCRGLEEIFLPDSITTIEKGAFCSCSKLKSIKLPKQVDSIEPSAFDGCWSLNIECDNPFFKSMDGVLFTADCKTLVCYPEGKGYENYVIPDSVSNIAEGAFHSFSDYFISTSCKSITLPKSMDKIASGTFKDHESLKRIECDSDYYKSIDGVLFTADFKTLVCYPRGRKDSRYTIPDSVVNIEKDAFDGCYSLDEIIIPNGSLGMFKQMLSEEIWDRFKEM